MQISTPTVDSILSIVRSNIEQGVILMKGLLTENLSSSLLLEVIRIELRGTGGGSCEDDCCLNKGAIFLEALLGT